MKRLSWLILFLFFTTGILARSLYKIEGNNVIIDLDGIGMKSRVLKIEVWTPRVVKLISGMSLEFSSFQGIYTERPQEPVKFKVGYSNNNIEISTTHILISVQEDGLARIFNRAGNKMLIESDRTFHKNSPEDESYLVRQRFFLNPHEDIYGFGQNTDSSRFCLRNQNFELIQNQEDFANPIFFSEKGYALLWDNYSRTSFSDSRSGLEIESSIGDEIQYFFIYGPEWGTIVNEIRNLTGKAPLLPYWAYGHWILNTQNEANNNTAARVEKYISAKVPLEKTTNSWYNLYQEEKAITDSVNTLLNGRLFYVKTFNAMKPKYESLEENHPEKRFCIPTHINYPGIQKYGTFLISDGIPCTWEALKCQVRSGINLSLSGQPYWSTTIGGTKNKAKKELDDELILRWYQFGVFTPVFTAPTPDRDIFSLGNSHLIDLSKKAIELRYHLLPYIYSTAANVSFHNKTFVRSLLFDFLNDENAHEADQQFLFGNSILVCPVTSPNVKQIPVYFPEGTDWFDFYTGKLYTGKTTQNADVTLNNIPLYIKAGTILPFAPTGFAEADTVPALMEIRIYPLADAEFELYEDAGDGRDYLNGQSATIKFSYSDKNKTLTIDNIIGNYPDMVINRTFHVVLVDELNGRGDQLSQDPLIVNYKGKRIKVKL